MSFQIPDGVIWTTLAALGGWVLRVETRLMRTLTHDAHNRICETKDSVLREDLQELKRMIISANQESREHREVASREASKHRDKINRRMESVNVRLAAVQTKLNISPTAEDTGAFRTES